MEKMDVFSWNPPAKRLSPEEVDRIVERMILTRSVDPGQTPMFQPARESSPELDLQRAILFDAVQCATRHHDSPIQSQQREARAALRWIESESDSYFLSFVPICQRLGLEPDWIRRLITGRIHTDRAAVVPQAA